MYLKPADFTTKSVSSSLMLQKGGGIGPGSYTRARKNMVTSPNLIRRFGLVSSAMKANCSQSDHCTGNTALVGKVAPDGKPYRSCDIAERRARLEGARTCARSTLPSV